MSLLKCNVFGEKIQNIPSGSTPVVVTVFSFLLYRGDRFLGLKILSAEVEEIIVARFCSILSVRSESVGIRSSTCPKKLKKFFFRKLSETPYLKRT